MAFVGASIREFIAKRLVPHAELEQEEAKRVTEMVAKGKEIHEQAYMPLKIWNGWKLDSPVQKTFGIRPSILTAPEVPIGYPGRFSAFDELCK